MPSASRSPRDERQANRSSFDASNPPADEVGDLIRPRADPARLVTSAELLTPEQFQAAIERGRVHQATGTYTEAENRAENPLRRGEAAGYSSDDIVAFYVARRGGDWRRGAYDLVKDAHAGNRPINRSPWDAVVMGAPSGYVRDGEVYRPAGRPPEGFVARKAVVIPPWAKVVALVANGIDGWPPVSDAVYSVEEFIKAGDGLQRKPRAGEWDVLVYAMDADNAGVTVRSYGLDNPYRRLRSARGRKAKQIARFSYMRWSWYDFTTSSMAAVRSLKVPAPEAEAPLRPPGWGPATSP